MTIDELIAWSRAGRTVVTTDLRRLDWSPAAIAAALEHVQREPDRAYLVAMALREGASEAYASLPAAQRARILCAALATQPTLNDWGTLEDLDGIEGPAARALLELGPEALASLRRLLRDTSAAPLRGSEAATLSHHHEYRRCDYAYRLACTLLGEPVRFVASTAERDRHIAALEARLDAADPGARR